MSKAFYLDLAERAIWTFLQAFCAAVLALQEISLMALETAVIAAALAVVKAFVAGNLGEKGTAAMPMPKSFGAKRPQ